MRPIDADKLRETITELYISEYEVTYRGMFRQALAEALVNEIDDAPTIEAVPVVRCKNCKHWSCIKDDGCIHSCDMDALLRRGSHFCSYGEKR